MNKYLISDDFVGTLASKSGFHADEPDDIETYIFDSDIEYTVEYVEEGEKRASVYMPENLKKSDKYTVFFGGNYALVDIRTTCRNGNRLLVIKDSYANSFVPFLIPYYSEIVMVDPRYYCDDIYELIEAKSIDSVLFLYNANTFFDDNSISSVLEMSTGG
jgi:hypothetical protein